MLNTLPLKRLTSRIISGRRDEQWEETPFVSIGGEHINDGNLNLENPRYISAALASALSKAMISTGDVLLVKDGATVGKCMYVRALEPGRTFVVNEHVFRIVSRDDEDARYLYYALSTPSLQEQIRIFSARAAQPGLSREDLASLPVPCQSQATQSVIADFLDRETAKADFLIAKYERLVELLEEKRVSLITQAVTKGLDPNAPMKESRVIGVGKVPYHWGVAAVWMLFNMGRGRVISHEDILASPGDYPVYSSQTENEGEMGRIGTYDFDGDYLTWTTDGANAGTVFERHGRFNCTNVCGTLKPRVPDANLAYFRYGLDIATKYFVRLDINPKLMNDVMARIRVPVPPKEEQDHIVAFLGPALERLVALQQRSASAMRLLREHRAALITAAVTGQIDVRTYKSEPIEVPA